MESTSGAVKNLMRMLECLDFPALTEITVDTLEGIQKIIIWLEDRKIRALDVGDREPLRTLTADWETKVSEVSVTCVRCLRCCWPTTMRTAQIVFRKCRLRTGMESQQSYSVFNVASKLCSVIGLRGQSYVVALVCCITSHLSMQLIRRWVGKLGRDIASLYRAWYTRAIRSTCFCCWTVSTRGWIRLWCATYRFFLARLSPSLLLNCCTALMQRIARFVRLVLSPEAIAAVSAGGLTDKVINDLPLGFDTSSKRRLKYFCNQISNLVAFSDGQVNKVALVLRLLYLDDFQELQQEFNSLIVLGQEYTANP